MFEAEGLGQLFFCHFVAYLLCDVLVDLLENVSDTHEL